MAKEVTEINIVDFIEYVDMQNSGYDRSCVFHYLEDFLESIGSKADIEELLRSQYD